MEWSILGEKLDAKCLRDHFGVSYRVPIVESPDVSAPTLTGERGGFYTKGGDRVRHPSAYSRRGWSNITYVRSSLRILVPKKQI